MRKGGGTRKIAARTHKSLLAERPLKIMRDSDTGQNRKEQREEDERKFITLSACVVAALLLLFAYTALLAPLFLDPVRKSTITDWLLVVITTLYASVSYWQWRAMRDGLRMTRESNRLTLRAWVVVREDLPLTLDNRPDIRVKFKLVNNGKIPAIGRSTLQCWVERTFPTFPLLPPSVADSDSTMVFALGPNHEEIVTHRLPTIDIVDRTDIRGEKLFLVFALTLEYTDALKSKGRTRVNGFYDPTLHAFIFGPDGNTIE